MRLSDLIELDVVDADDEVIGTVADVVLVQDGPVLPGQHAASFRVAGIIVVEHRHTKLLGYERDVRPAVFRALVRRWARDVFSVPWQDVAEATDERVVLRRPRSQLEQHDPAARR